MRPSTMVNWRSAYSKARLSCTYVVVDDLGERSQTVGGARGVGDDLVLGLVGIEVNTTDEPGHQSTSRVIEISLTWGHRRKEQR
jgi:hypothetical protein